MTVMIVLSVVFGAGFFVGALWMHHRLKKAFIYRGLFGDDVKFRRVFGPKL